MIRHFLLNTSVLFLILLVGDYKSNAQNREILDNRVLYSKFTIADFFSEKSKWIWELDMVYRRQSIGGGNAIWEAPLRQSVRPWIAYQATKMTRISFQPFGIFMSAPRYPIESDLNREMEREFRSTLQINNYAYYKRYNFTHRLRFESRHRFLGSENGPIHNWRIRYRIRTRIPLNTNYFYKNRTIYMSQYSEAHIEFGKNYGTNYLSQNRNYIGLGYRFWDWTRVELGYLHQYNFRGNNQQIDLSRGIMFYLFIDLLSKMEQTL